jgi:excisionase family DNA binding protein
MNAAPDPASQLITVRIKEACRITGIGRSKLYELIADGEVEIIKIGAMTLIPIDALSRFIERRRARSNRR